MAPNSIPRNNKEYRIMKKSLEEYINAYIISNNIDQLPLILALAISLLHYTIPKNVIISRTQYFKFYNGGLDIANFKISSIEKLDDLEFMLSFTMNIFIEDMVKYGKHKLDYNSLETTTKNGLGYGTPNVDRFFQYGESIYDTDNERFRIHEFSSICIGPGGFYARTYHDIRVVQTTISVENFKNSEIIKIFIKILEYSRNTFFEYCNNEILQLYQ